MGLTWDLHVFQTLRGSGSGCEKHYVSAQKVSDYEAGKACEASAEYLPTLAKAGHKDLRWNRSLCQNSAEDSSSANNSWQTKNTLK